MIMTKRLTKIYNRGEENEVAAVKGVSINIEDGDLAIVTGPSGSGKTTLLSLLGLLTRPTAGKVFYDDEEVSSYSDAWQTKLRKKEVGFVFQQFNLLPQFSAWENVSLPLLCRDVDKDERRKLAIGVMEELGLRKRVDFKVAQLSAGEQQRVAIARALITDPRIILADEPTASVDGETARSVLKLFKVLKEAGKTIIVSTHDPAIMREGTALAELKEGALVNYSRR